MRQTIKEITELRGLVRSAIEAKDSAEFWAGAVCVVEGLRNVSLTVFSSLLDGAIVRKDGKAAMRFLNQADELLSTLEVVE